MDSHPRSLDKLLMRPPAAIAAAVWLADMPLSLHTKSRLSAASKILPSEQAAMTRTQAAGSPNGEIVPQPAARVALTVWYTGKAASQAPPTILRAVIEGIPAREGGAGGMPVPTYLGFPRQPLPRPQRVATTRRNGRGVDG